MEKGKTALHKGCGDGKPLAIAEYLIVAGADTLRRDKVHFSGIVVLLMHTNVGAQNAKTAFDLVKSNDDKKFLDVLILKMCCFVSVNCCVLFSSEGRGKILESTNNEKFIYLYGQ
jgi:hypothetical protein